MINAGAIVVTSLLKPKLQMADRFDYVSFSLERDFWTFSFHNLDRIQTSLETPIFHTSLSLTWLFPDFLNLKDEGMKYM